MNRISIVVLFALAACGNQPAGNAMTNAEVPDGPMPAGAPPIAKAPVQSCDPPKLDFAAAPNLGPKDQARYVENFRAAYDKACAGKLFADRPLIDEGTTRKSTLFVLNAPEANVTSIYLGTTAGPPPRMLIESPFGTPPQIPSVDDLHESIYCAVIGATEEEQETSGRCLPD